MTTSKKQLRQLSKAEFYYQVVGFNTMLEIAEDFLDMRTEQALRNRRTLPANVRDSIIELVCNCGLKQLDYRTRSRVKAVIAKAKQYENIQSKRTVSI